MRRRMFYCGEVTEHPEASYLSTPEEFANQLDESEWDFSEEENTQIVIGRFELNFQVRGSMETNPRMRCRTVLAAYNSGVRK